MLKTIKCMFTFVILIFFITINSNLSMRISSTESMMQQDAFLKIKSSSLGDYITDKKGMALYLFENDSPNKSNCIGECEKKFMPFLAEDVSFPPEVPDRLDQTLVGVVRRPDGKYQVTYNKVPLYYYINDRSPGDLKGHRQKEFGGLWSLMKPDGTALDSRIGASIQKLIKPEGMYLTVSGLSSILLIPDTNVIKLSITENNKDINKALSDMDGDIQQIQTSLKSTIDSSQIIMLERKINSDERGFAITQDMQAVTKDLLSASQALDKINSLNPDLKSKIGYAINFSVSGDTINDGKAILYGDAIKDALDNAGIILDPLSLTVNKDNAVRSINIDSTDLESLNPPMNPSSFTALPILNSYNSILMTMKADVTYNLKKK